MSNARTLRRSIRLFGEPDAETALSKLMQEKPTTREQHLEALLKRGDTRRRVEDHLLTKASLDLW
ncbi:hypothetical protein FNU76_20080 [Chitinimonas arctica]|uniref:Uncharacterized protein n=1 Tax=Chitinimonas arctica TaxID=2594795 RepID=A0A516SJY5_9NEIS|nr:hypothetical protein [Chitinimonas arctica]QDQ28471.1 hypothetical protein FNU76_20080 [Chitinimonas arctica]